MFSKMHYVSIRSKKSSPRDQYLLNKNTKNCVPVFFLSIYLITQGMYKKRQTTAFRQYQLNPNHYE